MLARKTEPEAVIVFRSGNGNTELVNAGWPKIGVFGIALIEREPYLSIKRGHVDCKLTRARGIYKITQTNILKGIIVGELVYEEGP